MSCECGHCLDRHVLVQTGTSSLDGGITICPSPWCRCWKTWAPEGMKPDEVRVPNMDEVLAIRARIQGVSMWPDG